MLLLNMLYDIFNINFYKIYDFIFEDSIVTTIMLYISSIIFEFCNLHKIVRRWVATMIGNRTPIDWYEIC